MPIPTGSTWTSWRRGSAPWPRGPRGVPRDVWFTCRSSMTESTSPGAHATPNRGPRGGDLPHPCGRPDPFRADRPDRVRDEARGAVAMSERTIDLNADLGEGFPNDEELLGRVTSVSVACGAHAGDP